MSAVAMQSAVSSIRRKSCWLGTPEIYFRKTIDNSRLVKVEDPRREREMKYFGLALCLPVPAGHGIRAAAFPRH